MTPDWFRWAAKTQRYANPVEQPRRTASQGTQQLEICVNQVLLRYDIVRLVRQRAIAVKLVRLQLNTARPVQRLPANARLAALLQVIVRLVEKLRSCANSAVTPCNHDDMKGCYND